MESDLQSLFGLLCTAVGTYWLKLRNSPPSQCCGTVTSVVDPDPGSGSGLDPYSIGPLDPDPDP
jgi:hypothetical protein